MKLTDPNLNVVLYEPEIPPNTGNIGRLCLATGSRLHLIEPLGFQIDEKTVRRAGLDYWKDVDVSTWPSLNALQQSAPDQRFLYFTTKTRRCYWDQRFQKGDYLVFGPESRGLPEDLLNAHPEHCLSLPTEGVRSLNLSSSAAIAVYEGLRQLRV